MHKEKLHETLSIELTHDMETGEELFEVVKDGEYFYLSAEEMELIIDFLKETSFINKKYKANITNKENDFLFVVKKDRWGDYDLATKHSDPYEEMTTADMARIIQPFYYKLIDTKAELIFLENVEHCLERLIKEYRQDGKWYERWFGIPAIYHALKRLKNYN